MITDFSDFLAADCVETGLHVSSKKALFQHLAAQASRRTKLDTKRILTAISDREKTGTTGFGGGIAIAHGKVAELPRIFGHFVRLGEPIAYQAIDQLPVDLVFLLLSPPDAGADHLRALATVSRALRNTQVLAKLRGARSRDALYAVLAGTEARDAA